MKKLFTFAILALIVWFTIIFVRPYWDRYWLQMDIEEAALYGTKRTVGEVRSFLVKKMQEKGRNIRGEDFLIEKDKRNTVYVTISYSDEVRIAGHTLKRLQFTLKARKTETTSSY
jgi:hypothetical protein